MKDFQHKVVLVTGGTSGIGEAAALLFASSGAKVAITGRRKEYGESVVRTIKEKGGEALYLPADHLLTEDCARVVNEVVKAWGRIDVLFNNAGVVTKGTAETTDEETWQLTLNLNVTAVWRMSKLVLPVMRAQRAGVIINNASDWGLVGAKNALAYCTSKGAVIQMTRAMALDHARENIRVNAVCPGDTFVTRWLEQGYFESSESKETLESLGEALPLGRVANAKEIANAVVFLASDAASFITGVAMPVDGGNTAA
jgi:meso-butanediol dehydrogenase / (S,S)-butanediol dehydrogenase / diacetyl reductase